MRRLWLHIGSHKTGTTAIQKTFARSRDALRQAGLTYPWNRLWFPDDPGEQPRGYAQHYIADEAATLTPETLDRMHAGFDGEEWLMSSETFSVLPPPTVKALFATLSQRFEDIHAVMYVREPGALAVSLAATRIIMGRATYEEVCKAPRIYRYRQYMAPWMRQLGPDRFTVRVYDKARLANANVVEDILGVLGRDGSAIPLRRHKRNVTPSHDAILALSERNAGNAPAPGAKLRSIPGPPFTLPQAIVDHVRRESAEDVAWLHRRFGITFDA